MTRSSVITLENEALSLGLAAKLGASVTSLEFLGRGERRPVLLGGERPDLRVEDSALFPMAPFANRARDNVIGSGNHRYRLQPNTSDPLALHGVAWQLPWDMVELTSTSCLLELEVTDEFVFGFKLAYRIAISGSSVEFELKLANSNDHSIPAGLGLHPYFPRRSDTTIRFPAQTLWPEGPGHLPTGRIPVPAEFDFSSQRPLPNRWINHCYSGWQGHAQIIQPSLGYSLEMVALNAHCLMLYSDPEKNRFALEPQSHATGENGPGGSGMMDLPGGDSSSLHLKLELSEL
ncbi:aldose 1-epimerase [Nitratireductor basaltis]|nr:aldose 1-epimerase [Nitratireductor basaltis]